MKGFVSTAIGKIYKIPSDKLFDLEAPRGLKSSNFYCLLISCKLLYCISFYMTRSRGPCQVKEYKMISEQSLLTGWLAGSLREIEKSRPV